MRRMSHRRPLALGLLALPLALTAACGSSNAAAPAAPAAPGPASSAPASTPATQGTGEARLRIVSTVAPITSIAANVGGDRVELTGVVPEGTNSHTYEPPPQVARVMETADIVLLNGLQLEEPTVQLAEANVPEGGEILELGTQALPEEEYLYDFSFPEQDGKPNPHLWTDPKYAIAYADQIRDVLVRRDPANAAYFEANHEQFVARAQALSDALEADQATIPDGKKLLVTYHDAYAYFAKDYGWTVVGAVQPSNFEDPQPKEIARLVDQIRAQQVPVIFGSEVFPSDVLQQIADETGARYEESLRDDDLPGAPGEPDHSWLGLMRYDYRTMIQGLGGTTTALDALDTSDVAPDRATYPQ